MNIGNRNIISDYGNIDSIIMEFTIWYRWTIWRFPEKTGYPQLSSIFLDWDFPLMNYVFWGNPMTSWKPPEKPVKW